MATQSNPSVKAGETDIITARKEAAAKLLPLFGGKTAEGRDIVGVFHTHGIAAVIGASADNAKFVDELRKNQSARDLAIFASAHGHPAFPPALVAEFLSRPGVEESNKWFAEVYLSGLREVFLATCSPGKMDGVGLVLQPARAGIDLLKAALNVFNHLTKGEANKLGLSKPEDAARQEFPSDLLEMAGFQLSMTFTPPQQLYRWVVKNCKERDADGEGNAAAPASDPAAALPQAPPVPKPEPTPAPAEPAVPDLSALLGGTPAPAAPAKASRPGKKVAMVVPAVAVIAPPPALPAEESKPASTAAVDEKELVASFLADQPNLVAKALAARLRGGKMTLEEAGALAKAKGLL